MIRPQLTVEQKLEDRYVIEHVVGQGGFGTVYCAHDMELNRRVAIKTIDVLLAADETQTLRKRTIREAQALSLLKHPSMVEVYRLGFLGDGRPFIVMEYVEATPLSELLAKDGPLSCRQATLFCLQIAEALKYAHEHGVLHRDLKPSNILVEKRPAAYVVRIVDFGLARITAQIQTDQTKLTVTGMAIGTPTYMSPEQCRGESVDQRSDIYSLGLLFFEMLTGKPAVAGDDAAEIMANQVLEPLPRLLAARGGERVPPMLRLILNKMTAKEKSARYANAEQLIRELNVLSDTAADIRLVSTASSPGDKRRRLKGTAITGGAVVSAMLAIACLAVLGTTSGRLLVATTAMKFSVPAGQSVLLPLVTLELIQSGRSAAAANLSI